MKKLFGIGLNKTGTSTLADCMRLLGYRHVSCRFDLLTQVHQGKLTQLFEVCDANDSFEDWPFPLVYRELFRRYGDNALYALTVRKSPEVWLRSLKNHSLTTPPLQHCRLIAYGYAYPHGVEREHLALYEKHNREVTEFFREQGALHLLKTFCWENSDGWSSLCSFLGVPTPDLPFPHSNKTNRAALERHKHYRANRDRIKVQLGLLGLSVPKNLIF